LESNWRWNVWELGFNVANIDLAARVVRPDLIEQYLLRFVLPDQSYVALTTNYNSTFGWQFGPLVAVPRKSYPYGAEVFPD